MTRPSFRFDLTPRVTDDNKLVLSVQDDGDTFVVTSLEDLLAAHPDAGGITLRVPDFFHNDTIYEPYGAVFGSDGRTIERYWEPAGEGTGVEHTFDLADQTRAADFLIGARPRNGALTEPAPAKSGGPLPIAIDPKKTRGGGTRPLR